MSLHSTSRSAGPRRAAAHWALALVSILVVAGVATTAEPPEDGGYCSTAAQDARRADIASERGGPPAVGATDRRCQR